MKKAEKGYWKTIDFPEKHSSVMLNKEVTEDELDQMKMGLIPNQMEDKWFIYFNEDWFFFHRSWTGTCIYKLKLKQQDGLIILSELLINRNEEQYKATDDECDKKFVDFLIERLLLGKRAVFPSRNDKMSGKKAIEIHHMIGYGRSDNEA